MVQAQSMQIINLNRKKTQGCVIYGIDQENKVSKGRRFQSKDTFGIGHFTGVCNWLPSL